eukprot:816085-Rhodomonas_salina.2
MVRHPPEIIRCSPKSSHAPPNRRQQNTLVVRFARKLRFLVFDFVTDSQKRLRKLGGCTSRPDMVLFRTESGAVWDRVWCSLGPGRDQDWRDVTRIVVCLQVAGDGENDVPLFEYTSKGFKVQVCPETAHTRSVFPVDLYQDWQKFRGGVLLGNRPRLCAMQLL